MERHDAMTRRPSLLAGGPEPANRAPVRERLLPSIDGTPPTRQPRRAHPRPWLLSGALLVVAATAAALWLQRPLTELPAAPLPAHGTTDRSDAEPARAATIIEEAPLRTGVGIGPPARRAPQQLSDLAVEESTAEPLSRPAPSSPFTSMTESGTGGAGNRLTAGVPAARPATAGARAAQAPASDEPPALLAVLLGHIQARPTPATEAQSGMDRMVAQLSDADGAGPQAQAPATEFRSWQIQLNLRECPPANTTEGVACRQAICEVYAGRDPACPAG